MSLEKSGKAYEELIASLASCFREIHTTYEKNPNQPIEINAEIQAEIIKLVDATRGFLHACLDDGIHEGVGDVLTDACDLETSEYPYAFAQELRILFSNLIMQVCEMEAREYTAAENTLSAAMQKIITDLRELSHAEIAAISRKVNAKSIVLN